jgi:trans-aconitate 2-methyltransferase
VTEWNSELYMVFERERTRAARDLLAKASDTEPVSVVDLGCGPGNSTQLLREAFPEARIVGVDLSENMLKVARERAAGVAFIREDIESWRPEGRVDLIFANATLHFSKDHYALIERLVSFLAPGGVLAAQMPNNMQEVSHAAMRMISADGPWAERLVPIAKTRAVIGPPDEYYRLLAPLCSRLDLWQTIYIHPLESVERIVDWFEGSELRPFLMPLTAHEREVFLARYRDELVQAYAPQPDGKVLLRYPRLFFVARK